MTNHSKMNLTSLPNNWPQRQDSLSDQFADLRMVANRLGFYDAADAIGQLFDTSRIFEVKYGCHCDLEEGQEPDGCVIDEGRIGDCIHARENMRKEQCKYWRVVSTSR
jgi:hypothetical protein